MMARQYVLFVVLVGCLYGELAHSQSSCNPTITGLLIRSTEQDTRLNETNLSVTWRADNDSGCEYRVELGTCIGNMSDFYCGETAISTNAVFPSADCSVQYQELIIKVNASWNCMLDQCASYLYCNSLNDTIVWPVEVGMSIVVPLPQAEDCPTGALPILCIGGRYNRCYGDLSSLPEHHEYDCQSEQQLLILRISNVSESLNGTLYTVVYQEFIPQCNETAVRAISNFQLVVNAGCSVDMLGEEDNVTNSRCDEVLEDSIGSASIPNGTVCYNGTILGSAANYSCDEEYQISGGTDSLRVCTDSGIWSGENIACEVIGCSVDMLGEEDNVTNSRCNEVLEDSIGSASIPNGTVCYNGTILGSAANYSCDEEYQISGGTDSLRVCTDSGIWSGENIACEVIECDPLDLQSGEIKNVMDSRCPSGTVGSLEITHGVVCYNGTVPGSLATYITNDGCTLWPYGTSSQRMCQPGGKWSGDEIDIGLKMWQLALNVVGLPLWVAGIIMTAIMLCRQGYRFKCRCNKKWHCALIVVNVAIHLLAVAYWSTGVAISVTNCENATPWVLVGFSLSILSPILSMAVLIFFSTIGKPVAPHPPVNSTENCDASINRTAHEMTEKNGKQIKKEEKVQSN